MLLNIECKKCDRHVSISILKSNSKKIFRCKVCGEIGTKKKVANKKKNSNKFKNLIPNKSTSVYKKISQHETVFLCNHCGDVINPRRKKLLPNTNLCTSCADKDPSGQANRRIKETWGTREDWKKDRSSWKKFNF